MFPSSWHSKHVSYQSCFDILFEWLIFVNNSKICFESLKHVSKNFRFEILWVQAWDLITMQARAQVGPVTMLWVEPMAAPPWGGNHGSIPWLCLEWWLVSLGLQPPLRVKGQGCRTPLGVQLPWALILGFFYKTITLKS